MPKRSSDEIQIANLLVTIRAQIGYVRHLHDTTVNVLGANSLEPHDLLRAMRCAEMTFDYVELLTERAAILLD